MATEPTVKRAVVFIDGQNLFHAVSEAFGYTYPNYCPLRLATRLCDGQGFNLHGIRFYTGVPDLQDNQFWHQFWSTRLLAMKRSGITTFSRSLRYRNKQIRLADGTEHTILVAQEKGIDVRIALDVTRMARHQELDVAVILSQDQDLSEVADELRAMAREQGRWIKVVSAFPVSPTAINRRGINGTDWVRIDRATYDACLDPRDYRPKLTS